MTLQRTTPFAVVAGDSGRALRVAHDTGPDGSYDDHADLVKSIDGTRCGQGCARRLPRRWGTAPLE